VHFNLVRIICSNTVVYAHMHNSNEIKPYHSYFKDKKVTVMGLGLLGRGIGDAKYIAEAGAQEVIVTDLKTESELITSVEQLRPYKNVRFVLGEHRLEDFTDRDIVLVAPSVPLDSEYVAHAVSTGARKIQSAALFVELTKMPIIGVTGTRGKSTTSAMIHHVLQVVTGEEVIYGGTVRGVSNLQLLNKVKEDSLAVFELDSWQLQGFGWAEISPHVAVFTNFMEDHLNYYMRGGKSKEEAMDLYFNDKAQIFLHQEESGVLITTPEVFIRAQKLKGTLGQEVILADASVLPEDMLLSMPGEHNRLNAALAYEALKAVGLTEEEIFNGLASFPGVEGRLQLIATLGSVRVYNDNNATTPQATTVAIKALAGEVQNIVLIAGGADKAIDTSVLVAEIIAHVKQLILIPGTGTDALVQALTVASYAQYIVVENLEVAVEEARLAAAPTEVILFSPGFASFSQYKNEYERNDEFVKLVMDLLDIDNSL
jgi:UDP-N-acetylmuramoylalanine--D-glutamate ligase